MKKKLFVLSCLLLMANLLLAQNITVSGTVTSKEDRSSIPGVSVVVKGTTVGKITDTAGKYTLSAPANATLVFSFVGLQTTEVPVRNQTVIDIALTAETSLLNEVVVVGYGTARVKDLTSPIAMIKSEDIVRRSTASPMEALQGLATGVQVTDNGQPGVGPEVRIRGVGSFGDANPLYVVDGMFYTDINFLNNEDIESINVLKDASAAAIYGVRAANGVVLITTKKGRMNQKATVTYDGYVGIQPVANMMKLTNSAQYTTIMTEAGDLTAVNASIAAWGGVNGVPTANTDWYKQLIRLGQVQNQNLDIRGGGENTAYLLGVNYYTQKGILSAANGSGYQRYNFHISGDYEPYKWLKLGANVIISDGTSQLGNNDAWFKAFLLPPIVPVYDNNNVRSSPIKFADPQTASLVNGYYANPVAIATYTDNNSSTFRVLPSFYAEIGFSDHLKLRTSFSQDVALNREIDWTPVYQVGIGMGNAHTSLSKSYDFENNFILDNVLTYSNDFGKNNLSAMVGQSLRAENSQTLTGSATDIPEGADQYRYITNGTTASKIAGDAGSTTHGSSFFSRVTYGYDSKYLLSLTMRADGSSKYQEKWGYFPSVGLGWVLSQENFMKNQNIFNLLKLRGSWGELGNDKVAASAGFAGTTTATPAMGDALVPGYVIQNTFSWLRWEVVEVTNGGVEMALLNNRLMANIDYYNRTTHNAVVSCPEPITGEMVPGNYGKIKNSGVELSLTWNDKIGNDFRYSVSLNASTLKNEVISLKQGVPRIYVGTSEFQQIDEPGQPMNAYYGYKIIGIYQNAAQIAADPVAVKAGLKPGDVIFQNLDGNDVIDANDRQVLGDPLPKFYYGGSVGLQYKNVDFNLSLSGVSGDDILNRKGGTRAWVDDMNFSEEFYKNRWTGEGSTNTTPSSAGFTSARVVGLLNSLYISDGSFLKIQNIQLGYTLNKLFNTKISMRLYLSAGPFMFFKYDGFTPEIQNGYDQSTYPMVTTYSFGIRITY
jgi:TonB-linked SusC/RagA family outer membrane protein